MSVQTVKMVRISRDWKDAYDSLDIDKVNMAIRELGGNVKLILEGSEDSETLGFVVEE